MKPPSTPLADFSSKNVQIFLILLSWVFYLGVLLIFQASLQAMALLGVAAIPVMVTGWLLGTRKGFIAAIVAIMLHLLLKITLEYQTLIWQFVALQHLIGGVLLVLVGTFVGYVRDLNEHQRHAIKNLEASEKKLSRYGELLTLINQARTQLLSTTQWEEQIANFVNHLGKSAQAERVCLYEIHSMSPDSFLVYRRHSWHANENQASTTSTLQKFTPDDDGIGFWVTHAQEGQPVTGQIATLPPGDRTFLSPLETGSFLVFPIFAQNELWGLIQFETSQLMLPWNDIELSAIRALVQTLGATIHRREIEKTISKRAKEIKTLYKNSLQVSSTEQLETTLLAILKQVLTIIPAHEAEIYLYADHKLTLGTSLKSSKKNVAASPLSLGNELAYSAARKNKALFVSKIDAHPLFQEAKECQAKASIALPLTITAKVVGVMNIWFLEPRSFPEEEVRLLHLFGNQAALAIHNTEYFKAEQEQRELAEALREANLKLTSNLELTTVLENILEQCLKLIPAQDAHIFLYDEETLALGAVMWEDKRKQDPVALPREGGLTYTIARSGERLLVPDMTKHRLFENAPSDWKGAIIGLPLKFRKKVIGVMNIAFSEPRSFTEKNLRILDLLSDQAALAINNARLFEAEKKQRRIAETLQITGQIVKSSLHLDTVLDHILTQLKNIVPYDTANLVLIGEEIYSARNLGYEKLKNISAPTKLSQESAQYPIFRRVREEKKPIIISDTESHPDWVIDKNTSYIRSWIGIPILGREGAIGFLFLNNQEKGFYKPKHAEWVAIFADQAAIAIDNALLFKNSQQYTRELQNLHQATSILVTTLELDKLLENILKAAIDAIPTAEKGSLLLNNPKTNQLELRAARGYEDERIKGFTISLTNGYAAQAFREGKAKIFNQIHEGSQIYYESEIADVSSIQSAISVPLFSPKKKPLGVLSLDSTKANAFDTVNLKMISSFAATATSAILNAQLHAEIQKLAVTDSLTSTLNRRGMFQVGKHEFIRAQRYNRPVSVIFFDLDHFKKVNDTYGHDSGDQILSKIAAISKKSIREIDILGRYGGEEFLIILPEANAQEAFEIAERIRKEIAAFVFTINGTTLRITLSLGVAEINDEIQEIKELIKIADQAMYQSKQNGRNQTTQYS